MAVIRPEIETDPAELEQIAIQYLMDALPGWEPAPGDLMTWLISAHAQMIAEERDIAADVPLAQILRPFGEQVYLLPPKLALPATVRATVTMRDRAGYKVPAGTEVLVRTAGDDGVTMVVVRDARTEPDRAETVEVQLEAAPGREGSAGNGLDEDNAIVPLRALEFIRSIAIRSPDISSGGRDAETDEEYLERLVDTLALSSPTPIMLEDFEAIARQVDGVERALAINLLWEQPEIVKLTAPALTGSIFEGGREIQLRYGSAMGVSEIRSHIAQQFAERGYVVDVTGGPDVFTLSFAGTRRYGPWSVSQTGTSASLRIVQEAATDTRAERAVAVVVVDEQGLIPDLAVRETVRTTLESLREVNWRISVIKPEYTDVFVDFRAVAWPGHTPEVVAAAAVDAVEHYLSPANWGRGTEATENSDVAWTQEPVVRYLEVAQILNAVPGLRYVESLALGKRSDALAATDIQLSGRAPLPRPARDGVRGVVTEG